MTDLIKGLAEVKEYEVGLATSGKTSGKFINQVYQLDFAGPSLPKTML